MNKLSIFAEVDEGQDPAAQLNMGGIANIVNAKPAVLKLMGNLAFAEYAHSLYPDILIEYREMALFEDEFNGGDVQPSEDAANLMYTRLLEFTKGYRYCYFTVWPNEPPVDVKDGGGNILIEESKQLRRNLNAYWCRLQDLCSSKGIKLTVGNFSNEANLFDKYEELLPMFQKCKQYGNLLNLHGYFSPTLTPQSAERDQYLFPHKKLAAVLNLSMPKVIYGEWGIDAVWSLGLKYPGYKTANLTNMQYANELIEASKDIANDPLVVGLCVFIHSRHADDNDKIDYNIAFGKPARPRLDDPGEPAVVELLIDYIRSNPGNIQPPVPIPKPVPQPVPDTRLAALLADLEAVVNKYK